MGDDQFDRNDAFDSNFEGQFSAMTSAAVQIHELYSAYVTAGFTPEQAMQILLVQVASAQRGMSGEQ